MFECQYGRGLGRDVRRVRVVDAQKVQSKQQNTEHWTWTKCQNCRRANLQLHIWLGRVRGLLWEEGKGERCQWHAPLHPIPIISSTIPAKAPTPSWRSTKYPMLLTFRHLALKVDCVNINTSNRLKQDRVFKSALCIDFDDSVASAHLLFRGRSNILKSKALSFF